MKLEGEEEAGCRGMDEANLTQPARPASRRWGQFLSGRRAFNEREEPRRSTNRLISFELGQDRGNVPELSERHRSLTGKPAQQPPRRWNVGLGFLLEQQQRDLGSDR
jgi:hypothetical protein